MPTRTLTARLMARYGGAAVLSRTVSAGGDPWAPGTGSTETWDVQLIETGREIDRDDTLVSDAELVAAMLPSDEVTPALGDGLTAGGTAYTVTAVHPVRANPAGDVLHWRLEARTGCTAVTV